MNRNFLNCMKYLCLVLWISGCVGGAALDNNNFQNAGLISFVIFLVIHNE